MRFLDDETPLVARIYIVCVVLLGTASAVVAVIELFVHPSPDLRWLILLGMTLFASLLPVELPGTGKSRALITVSDVFIFIAMVLYGFAVPVTIATVDSLLANWRIRKKLRNWGKFAFNVSQSSCSVFLVAEFFHMLPFAGGGAGVKPPSAGLFVDLSLAALLFIVLNSGAVALAMALVTSQSIGIIWRENFLWTSLASFASATAAFFVLSNLEEQRLFASGIALCVVVLTHYAFKMNRRRIDSLIRAQSFLQFTLNSLSAYIAILDSAGRIVAVNRVWEDFSDHSQTLGPAGTAGDDFSAILRHRGAVDPMTAEKIVRGLQRTARSEISGFSMEYSCGNDGSIRWFSLQVSRFLDEEETRVVVEFEDITARKQLEEQLRQSQKMEAIGRLAGGIAHDFNNILTIISGYGTFLQEAVGEDKKLKKHVDTILEAADRASAVTRQLLAFSRKQVMAPRVVPLNSLVADTEKLLRRLIGEDIELVTVLDPQGAPIRVDPGQFSQVLMNLAVNARDAMPRGGQLRVETGSATIAERTGSRMSARPGEYGVLRVKDSGHGMDRETVTHIFEPFYTTKEKGKGTGLGLSTVYGIIKQSGGHIEVQSQPGAGTTFEIYMPLADPKAEVSTPFGRRIPVPAQEDASTTAEPRL